MGGFLLDKQAQSFHISHFDTSPSGSKLDGSAVSSPAQSEPTHKSSNTSGLTITVEPAEAEIRKDYIYNEYAIIAPKRHTRPFDLRGGDHPLIETANSPKLDLQPMIASLPIANTNQKVKAVINKFPALTLQNPKAYGQQEIIIDTPYANTPTGSLSSTELAAILTMYQQRITELEHTPHVKYVQIFKNDGYNAGASLAHAHTQVFALPIIPPVYQDHLKQIQAYKVAHKSDPFDDIIEYEIKAKTRLIDSNDAAISLAPYASRWSLEAWIIPTASASSFAKATPQDILKITQLLQKLLRKLSDSKLDYNLFIEQGVGSEQRWVMKIYGRNIVSPLGGLEVSTGIMINTIPPEAAAKWYRD